MAGELTTATAHKNRDRDEPPRRTRLEAGLDESPAPEDAAGGGKPGQSGKDAHKRRERRKKAHGQKDKATHSGLPLLRRGPGAGWELSHVRRNAGVFQIEETLEHPREYDPDGDGVIVAIPSHFSFCVPLWLATEDRSLFPDMVRFQLEKRGLIAQNESTDGRLEINLITTENGRSLVLACLLSANFPEDLCFIDARAYELSANTYPVPDNAAALWREGDRLVLACRRKGSLAAIQTFNGAEIDPLVASEIACVLLEWISSDIMPEISRIQLWGEFSSEEQELLSNLWESEVKNDARPGMLLPAKAAGFLPPHVDLLRRRRRQGKRLMAVSAVAIAIYLVFLTVFVGQFALLKWEVIQLDNQLDENRDTVAMIQETQLTWDALRPAMYPEYYAVEQLLQASKPLPPEGVRFTLFQSQPDQIVIRGEARSFREAQLYYQKLEQVPELQDFTWTLGNPTIEADGRASFQIEGIRKSLTPPTDL